MSELDIQRNQRIEKLESLRERGINPYPNNFKPSRAVYEVLEVYRDYAEEKETREKLSIAGRISSKRGHGKTCFAHLLDDGSKLQIYARRDRLGDGVFEEFLELDIGDIIGVRGPLFRTRTGELTIIVESFQILTKSLRPLPEKWHGLKDIEKRYRQRYLDLLTNKESRDVFIVRSKLIKEIRSFFDQMGFIEVETPMMQAIPGGATAKPFKTYHNALNRELYLRIAPELYLKRLMVGGFNRIYELNRNFRNEGLSSEHNPEFTMLEFYMAYADYRDLMNLTERLFCDLAKVVKGSLKLEYQGNEIDFTPPWRRLRMDRAILEYCNLKEEDLENKTLLTNILKDRDIPLTGRESNGELLFMTFEHFVEPYLIQPIFIMDFPKDVSPLARIKDSEPDIVERFELYVAGRELANAFSELNDPIDQKDRFLRQAGASGREDIIKKVDDDYIQALEYGLPPTAGEGIGIDRMVMIFTNSPSIREVIFFPQLRQSQDS